MTAPSWFAALLGLAVQSAPAPAPAPKPQAPPARDLPARDLTGFGRTIALLGDQNEDEASEIAVGSPSDGAKRCGRVHVFSGLDGAPLRSLDGPGPDSGFGLGLDPTGDLDADGVPDLAVGAPFVKNPRAETGAAAAAEGIVQIHSGKDGSVLRTILPASDERYFGTDLVALGDLEGDGKPELLVRARVGAGETEHERFSAFSTASGRRLFAVDSPPSVTSHDLGRPLCALPDANADGTPDFAVEFGSDVHVRSGKDGAEIAVISSPLDVEDKSAFGTAMVGVPGAVPLLAVGDVLEEVYGSIRLCPLVYGAGADARAASDKAIFLVGDEDFRGFGRSLAAAGDLNGDKHEDVVLGHCDGRAGGLMVLSTHDLSGARALEGEPPEEGRLPLGWRVAAGRDVDGDGVSDVIASRWWPTAPASAARGVVVFSGRDGKRIRELSSPPEPEKKPAKR